MFRSLQLINSYAAINSIQRISKTQLLSAFTDIWCVLYYFILLHVHTMKIDWLQSMPGWTDLSKSYLHNAIPSEENRPRLLDHMDIWSILSNTPGPTPQRPERSTGAPTWGKTSNKGHSLYWCSGEGQGRKPPWNCNEKLQLFSVKHTHTIC